MNGSRVVIEVRYAAFGTHRLYSKNRIKTCTSVVIEYLHPVPISIQSIFYNLRNKTLCPFHIRSPNSSYTKRGASLAPLNFVSTHMFQIVFFTFTLSICQPVCKYQFPAVWCPIFPVLIFGLIIIRERLPFPLF